MSASNTEVGLMPSCSAFVLPMECGNDETVETLPLENEVASRNSASAFMRLVDVRYQELPFHHDYRSFEACRTLIDFRKRVGAAALSDFMDYVDQFGSEGIREFMAWIEEFEASIHG